MDPELEQIFQEWEIIENEHQIYLNEQAKELESNREKDLNNLFFVYLYLNMMIYCIKFIVLFCNQQIKLKNNKIDKCNYSVFELD